MDSIADNIPRIEAVFEVATNLHHFDALLLVVSVDAVRERVPEEDGGKEHLNADEKVLVGGSVIYHSCPLHNVE